MKKFLSTLGLITGTLASHAQAVERPLWEAGFGIAGISFPDYRGANERTVYALPAPYFVYRGDFLKADKQKVRGVFFKSGAIEIDLSFSGTPPVKSKNNFARTGMPDLDGTLEIGPSLNLTLFDSGDKRKTLELRMPVRAVIASDFKRIHGEGMVFQPQLNLDNRDFAGVSGLNLGIAAGPLFGDHRYHQYIYGVQAPYTNATRSAYQAQGGYAGSQLITAVSKRFPSFWAGAYMKYDNLSGATFENSPLVKSKNGFTAGIGISWILGVSEKRVDARD